MAYRAVVSAKLTIQHFLDSSELKFHLPNLEMEAILEELCRLGSKLSNFQPENDVDEQIKFAADQLKDLIESYQLVSESGQDMDRSYLFFFKEVKKFKGEIHSLNLQIEEEIRNLRCGCKSAVTSIRPDMVYAAVVSAKLTIECFLLLDSSHHNSQMKSIDHNICCLESSILPYTCFLRGHALETQIEGLVRQLKDLIESHKLFSAEDTNSSLVFFKKLGKINFFQKLVIFDAEICSFTRMVQNEIQKMRSGNYSSTKEDPQPKKEQDMRVIHPSLTSFAIYLLALKLQFQF